MSDQISQQFSLHGMELIWFSLIVAFTTLGGWAVVFNVIQKKSETLGQLIAGGSFVQNLTVVGVVIATTSLGALGAMKGELCATVFSGIVGYVLGSMKARKSEANRDESKELQPPARS